MRYTKEPRIWGDPQAQLLLPKIGCLGWEGNRPSWRSLTYPSPHPYPHHQDPGAPPHCQPTGPGGTLPVLKARSRKIRGCCEGPRMHLQTDVPNKSPAAPRAKTAGGLAEAKVTVNRFGADLSNPSQLCLPSSTVAHVPEPKRFHVGKKVGCAPPPRRCGPLVWGLVCLE